MCVTLKGLELTVSTTDLEHNSDLLLVLLDAGKNIQFIYLFCGFQGSNSEPHMLEGCEYRTTEKQVFTSQCYTMEWNY